MSGYVTGATVVALKFDEGVLMIADTKLSLGRMARYMNVKRMQEVSKNTLLCSSGDAADHQYLSDLLKRVVQAELLAHRNDESKTLLNAEMLLNYTSRVLYARRTKLDPVLVSAVVGGFSRGEPFLGYTDYYGTKYTDDFVVTGLGKYFAIGPLRDEHRPTMSLAEAKDLAVRCMRLLYLRDCAASVRVQVGYVTKNGVFIDEPFLLDSKWDYAKFAAPTSALPIAGNQF
ncbi:proteasome subunit [Theileria orientalis]|uniref:Proteasome subunit beta n=1 Tax=Theileria orientalis TaxID=68886 RepID=A0A976QVA1_THEOR|nr:proteasome subunit [Theileria orientalis]